MVDIKGGQALVLWRDVALAQVRDEAPDLTPRQMAILTIVYLEAPPHTVRGLAARLGVTKPVITRAVTTMGLAGLLERRRDDADRRNVLIGRTVEGSTFLDHLATTIVSEAAALPR